ncbi:MAG TPA: hypothetical protein VKD72_15535 [Gemmataceae bacterium]|nr:hypothetical protein [Gemmataceae bacterium]
MKLDKDTLLKNQFWIGLAGAGVLLLATIVLLFLGPAKRAAKAREEYDKFTKTLNDQRDFKNQHFWTPWNERKGEYTTHKEKVWADAYVIQDGLMTWPQNSTAFQNLEKTGYFGDSISEDARVLYRDKLYDTQFPKEKEGLEVFLNSRDAYLPFIIDRKLLGQISMGKLTPTVEECWLAQEDLWLRREVLRILQEALESMGKFKEIKELRWNAAVAAVAGVPVDNLVKTSPALKRDAYKQRPLDAKADKIKALEKSGVKESRLFRSRNWEVNLLLEEPSGDRSKLRVSARSTIKNINPSRRSLSLVNSAGQGLQLQLRQRPEEPPKGKGKVTESTLPLKRIVGVLLPYGEQAEFKVTTEVDARINPTRDFDLEEVFDRPTSPIKRLEALEIGEAALPHRLRTGQWAMDVNSLAPAPEAKEGASADTSQSPGGTGSGSGSGGFAPGGMTPPGGDPGKGGKAADKFRTDNYKIHRDRYVTISQVVRRVPIAFTVVVDQDQRNEILTAVANSNLRIQTTQVYWAHRPESSAEVKKTDVIGSGRPSLEYPGGGPPPGGGSGGFRPPMPPGGGPPPGGGSGGFRPPGDGSGGPTRPPGVDPDEGKPRERPGEGFPGRSGGTPEDSVPSLSEANRNLIGLTVHGITTLYERYPPKKKDEGTNQGGPQSK